MATLFIREFSKLPSGATSSRDLSCEPGTDQTVTYTTTTQSTAFASSTSYITITSDGVFHFVVGTNPVATTGALRIPASTLHTISVLPGHKVAAVAGT